MNVKKIISECFNIFYYLSVNLLAISIISFIINYSKFFRSIFDNYEDKKDHVLILVKDIFLELFTLIILLYFIKKIIKLMIFDKFNHYLKQESIYGIDIITSIILFKTSNKIQDKIGILNSKLGKALN